MKVHEMISCTEFPCLDVNHGGYIIPRLEVDASQVKMVMISEAAPEDKQDYYYAGGDALFERNTVQAFREASVEVASFKEILDMGVYLTNAVKCSKTGYGVKAGTINECSKILERELALFPNLQVMWLMGDVAIKAINYIAKRAGEARVIPAGSTYKIRGQEYYFRECRAFPSYLQVGPSFGIEKSKVRMIAEDIAAGLAIKG